ncbi:MAG: glycosyltransferase family 2 protein [Alphaproteobacteria bacterium]|nr:glycosyltransferase family 2 protein [Alphaproteobacteria bacterium]
MATYNGERFIADQLASLEAQDHIRWSLYVSDDGSTDRTRSIISKFAAQRLLRNDVQLVDGPGKGFVVNFLTALCGAPDADFYALADQDDIWGEAKLSEAIGSLTKTEPGRPALYCGRSQTADIEGKPIGLSPGYMRPPSFGNALVQNIGAGNTMVMNREARDLVRDAGPHLDVVFHDWWIYQLVSGAGGTVIYDLRPFIRYRQHSGNLVGEGTSLKSRIGRLRQMMKGRLHAWMDRNLGALQQVKHLLTAENERLLEDFIDLRQQWWLGRVSRIHRLGVSRQTWVGNVSLALATALGKL